MMAVSLDALTVEKWAVEMVVQSAVQTGGKMVQN